MAEDCSCYADALWLRRLTIAGLMKMVLPKGPKAGVVEIGVAIVESGEGPLE